MSNTTTTTTTARKMAHSYLPHYELVGTAAAASDLSFYEACQALIEAVEAGELRDGTHIRRQGRAVAFYCEWRQVIRPMFGAFDDERDNCSDWAFKVSLR